MLWSYFWGLVNKPKDFIVPNCDNKNALDEVLVTTSLGGSILTIVTLGIVSPVKSTVAVPQAAAADRGVVK